MWATYGFMSGKAGRYSEPRDPSSYGSFDEYKEEIIEAFRKKEIEVKEIINVEEWPEAKLKVTVRRGNNDRDVLGGKNTSEEMDRYHISSLSLEE